MPTFSVPHLLWIEVLKTGNLPHILTLELGFWYFSFTSTPTSPQLSDNGDPPWLMLGEDWKFLV